MVRNKKIMANKTGMRHYQITDKDIVFSLNTMALKEEISLQKLVENQLTAMGNKGISYLDLWQQCEAMAAQLRELSK